MKVILGMETGPGAFRCLKCGEAIFDSPKVVLLEAGPDEENEPLRTLGEFCPGCSRDLTEKSEEYPGVDVRCSRSQLRWFLTDVAANMRIFADELEQAEILDLLGAGPEVGDESTDGGLGTPLSISLQEMREAVVVEVSGPVNLANVGSFQEVLSEALERSVSGDGGSPCVVVDLTRCEAMNSRGLWAVLDASRELRESGGELRVADAVEGRVRRMFEAASADHGLLIYPDLSAALTNC